MRLPSAGVLYSGADVLVYGGGGYGQWVSRIAGELGLNVLAVLDEAPIRCTWTSAVDIQTAALAFPGNPVLLGVFSPQPDIAEIAWQLREAGFTDLVTPPAFFTWLAACGVTAERYWLTTEVGRYLDEVDQIAAARALLADPESVSIFDALLEYRHGGAPESCPLPRPLAEQHTGIDFGFLPEREGIVVDCGAYTGDTFANWAAAGLHHEAVLALEPEDASYALMSVAAADSPLRVIPLPIGVAERTARCEVQGSGASAVLVESSAGSTVAVSLDSLLASTMTTLIKMDIEGGEAAALRGAVDVLRRDHPHLAISVYHKPWHLWTIANWLESAIGGYRYRLRVYGHQGYDTVLYASPLAS